jgi:phosphoribosylanthranilate isomerase
VTKSPVVGRYGPAELRRRLEATAGLMDGCIADTYDLVTGATGRIHDWAVSRALAALPRRPLVLAGGLTPDDVREATREVRTAGVNVHTGVERQDGHKNAAPTRRFPGEGRVGFAALGPGFPEPTSGDGLSAAGATCAGALTDRGAG